MFKYYSKFQSVLILSTLTFSISLHAFELSPSTYSPDIQRKPQYGCKPEYGKLACKWEGECVDLGSICASCKKGYRYSGALNECYSCPAGYSLNTQLMCS